VFSRFARPFIYDSHTARTANWTKMSEAAPMTVQERVTADAPTLSSVLLRYAMTAAGPISISAAHFVAAIIFLHTLARAEFGLFSFVFVIVSFCFSMSGALFGASLVNSLNTVGFLSEASLASFMKANALFSVLAACVVFALMLGGSATPEIAALIALYGGVMTMRWFARSHAYAIHKMKRAIISDLTYSTTLLAALGTAAFAHTLTPVSAGASLAICACFGLAAFGGEFLYAQIGAVFTGSLRGFLPVWKDLARWSLLGVVTTEAASNAHAYLVTFISGPHAFALLAVGALFMRPVSLVMTALPDAERPAMARAMAQNKVAEAMRALFQFRVAGFAVLVATIVLAAVILIWFPQLVIKDGYDPKSVVAVVCIYIAIVGIRVARTPDSVFLQVLGEYRDLSSASVRSSFVSVAVVLALLLAFGPLVSLLGIVAGEAVGAHRVFVLTRRWRKQNGL
jgi:O-antigen/teichoic acid export membrane protein